VVVEPSFESINLASKIKDLAVSSGVKKIFAVLNFNKPVSADFEVKLKNAVLEKGMELISSIPFDAEILRFGLLKDKFSVSSKTIEEIKNIADKIVKNY